jgi:hypothetical protein
MNLPADCREISARKCTSGKFRKKNTRKLDGAFELQALNANLYDMLLTAGGSSIIGNSLGVFQDFHLVTVVTQIMILDWVNKQILFIQAIFKYLFSLI